MTTSGIGPISNDDGYTLQNPDDDGLRAAERYQVADERYHNRTDELYQRWKEGDL